MTNEDRLAASIADIVQEVTRMGNVNKMFWQFIATLTMPKEQKES